MKRNLGVVVVLASVACASCQRASTTQPGARTFQYQPANVGRYRVVEEGASAGPRRWTLETHADLAFRAGPTPLERDVFIETMDRTDKAHGDIYAMRISSDEYYTNVNGRETDVLPFQRAGIDLAALTETPITIATFDPNGHAFQLRPNPDYPLEKLAGMGDMLDDSLNLFPDLPKEAISPGHHWFVTRNVPVGSTAAHADSIYDFTYVGDSKCPSGAGACALLTFEASATETEIVTDKGLKARVVDRLAGTVFFNEERGVVDESRARGVTDIVLLGRTETRVTNYKIESRI